MFENIDWQGSGGVRYVVPGGSGTNWMSWADALPSIQSALTKRESDVLILVSPGQFSGDNAKFTVTGSRVTIRGAGPGTRLEGTDFDAIAKIQPGSGPVAIEDISILNVGPVGHAGDDYTAVGIKGVLSVSPGLVLRRCHLQGHAAVAARVCSTVLMEDCVCVGIADGMTSGGSLDDAARYVQGNQCNRRYDSSEVDRLVSFCAGQSVDRQIH